MRDRMQICGTLAVLAMVTAGCGESGPPMAEAGGQVTYNGNPLEGATIVFLPESGPPATGTTDATGRFSLNTRGKPGAVVGAGKVSVTAVEQLIELTDESKMSTEDLDKMSRWLIPKKFGHVMTSGLTEEVSAEEPNDWTFDLTGPVIKPSDKAISPSEPPAEPTPQEA